MVTQPHLSPYTCAGRGSGNAIELSTQVVKNFRSLGFWTKKTSEVF